MEHTNTLDQEHPVSIEAETGKATRVTYDGQNYTLGPNIVYVDGSMPAEMADQSPYLFNDACKALAYINERDESIMMLFAPGVYWLDNPDDTAIRRNSTSTEKTPYAQVIKCKRLTMKGLAAQPQHVVLAVNRGQMQGAIGNYTMMYVNTSQLEASGITFGNFCNVDLDFPLDSTLCRPRRANAIVQAQLIHTNALSAVLKNCRFLSRLNLCPCNGAKSTYFEDCHFECTDDALPGNGQFVHCTFDFYSDKPFYKTGPEGASMTNCKIRTKFDSHKMRFVKDGGFIVMKKTFIDDKFVVNDTLPKGEDRLPRKRGKMVLQNFDKEESSGGSTSIRATLNRSNQIYLRTDFHNVSLAYQPEVAKGKWTFDGFKPYDTKAYDWQPNPKKSWYYGTGEDGCEGVGLVTAARGARFFYTPNRDKCMGMKVEITIDPAKTAGQGFGSATGQYLDVCIKFDAKTLTGYALRIERSADYDKAVLFSLVKYSNGRVIRISDPVPSACFRTTCTITIEAKGTSLTASASTSAQLPETLPEGVSPDVHLSARITTNDYTAVGVQHTGSVGSNALMIHTLNVQWR